MSVRQTESLMTDGRGGLSRWLVPSIANILFITLFFDLSLLRGSELLNDADTGYHIRAGQYILQTGAVPKRDIFSFISPPLPWTAHEWGSEVIMALLHDAGGLTAVVVFYAFLIALTYCLLYKMVRARSGNLLVALFIVLLAQGSSSSHWLARPHIFTLFFLIPFYYIVDSYQRGEVNRLYFLPLIMVVWVNLHGGFVVGFVLLAAYLLGNLIQPIGCGGQQLDVGKLKALGLACAGCLAATLLNPYGTQILSFPFTLVGNKFIMDGVPEFLSPNFHDALVFKYLLLLLITVFLLCREKANAVETILILLFTNMALYSVRHIPLFAIITAPILARRLDAFADGKGAFLDLLRRKAAVFAAVEAQVNGRLLPLVAILFVISCVARGAIAFGFDPHLKAVGAARFLLQERVPGKMFNSDEIGDYIIYSSWPAYKVFVDGRLDMYGTPTMKQYMVVKEFAPGWEEILERYGIGVIVFDADSALSRFLVAQKGWRMVYADTVAAVFVKDTSQYRPLIEKYPDVRPLSARQIQ